MNKEVMTQILNKIKEYNKIVISRHIRPDGDCVGATTGLREILRDSFPNKDIRLINTDYAQYLDFLGEEDNQVKEEYYNDALAIVVDTSVADRCSNPLIKKAKEIIKIDHHIEKDPFGTVCWVEEEKSSACELIVEFYNLFKEELVLSKKAAISLYTGIVTDSGRFKFSSVNGDTLRTTSILLDKGIDIENIYSHLYLKSRNELKLQGYLQRKIKFTKEKVVYVIISQKLQKKYNLLPEEASAQISLLEGIKGSFIWVAFIENSEKKYRVRIRSRYVAINQVAENHNGGGHERASGATAENKKEIKQMLGEFDVVAKTYKESNPLCL